MPDSQFDMDKANRRPEPIPNYGDHMTLEAFVEHCRRGLFNDYDGHGEYASLTHLSGVIIYPSDITQDNVRREYSHVMWFNK